jgi:hypothetical protein
MIAERASAVNAGSMRLFAQDKAMETMLRYRRPAQGLLVAE